MTAYTVKYAQGGIKILFRLRPVINAETYVLDVYDDGRWECPHGRDFAIGAIVGAIAFHRDHHEVLAVLFRALEIVKHNPEVTRG